VEGGNFDESAGPLPAEGLEDLQMTAEDFAAPALPVSGEAKGPATAKEQAFRGILDSEQNSLSTTEWGNSVNNTLANKPSIVVSRECHFPPEIVYSKMFITGLSGSGKSWTVGVMMEECARLGLQFVCFDALGAHQGMKQLPNVVEIVPTMEMHPNMERLVDEVERNPDMSVVIDCSHIDDPTCQKIVAEYVEALFRKRLMRGLMTFFEECQDLVPQNKPSLESYGPIVKMCKKGRQYGYGVCLISQRPSEVSKAALTQCTTHIIHNVIQTRDLMAVKEQIAQGTDRTATNNLLDKIRNFEIGECLVYSPSLVPDMTQSTNHFLLTTTRSDRSTEHSGENVVVTVKGEEGKWAAQKSFQPPNTIGGMRVHFDAQEEYDPYDIMAEDRGSTTIGSDAFADAWMDDDWDADFTAEDEDYSSEPKEWSQPQGSYQSPFSYDGFGEDEWSADMAPDLRKALPSENDSPLLQSVKILGAVLLTAGGLFLVLKPQTARGPVVRAEERSPWVEKLDGSFSESETSYSTDS